MRDVPVASELSYLVLQRRRELSELATPPLDSSNQRLYPLPCSLVQREAFIASRETIHDAQLWENERQRHRARG